MAVWSGAAIGFSAATFVDRILLRDSIRRRAIRLRKMLQGMGGTGVKIGQQLGLRADILPIEYCDELMKLLDQVPPFPSQQAVAILEGQTGRTLAEIFESFDTEVIGSGSRPICRMAEKSRSRCGGRASRSRCDPISR
jgi:predicted unusual protein kinase regulating ubiquinone biosynthesis (AarF/ABC1/UbiB family)